MRRACFTLAVTWLTTTPVAQPYYPPFDREFSGTFTLLRLEQVCRELKIDAAQAARLDAALAPVRKRYEADLQRLGRFPPDQWSPKAAALREETAEAGTRALATVLRPEQLKRYRQLVFLARGPAAFLGPDVQKALALTDLQKERVKATAEETKQDLRRMRVDDSHTRYWIDKEQEAKTVNELTDVQKRKWQELTGRPFEFRHPRARLREWPGE